MARASLDTSNEQAQQFGIPHLGPNLLVAPPATSRTEKHFLEWDISGYVFLADIMFTILNPFLYKNIKVLLH